MHWCANCTNTCRAILNVASDGGKAFGKIFGWVFSNFSCSEMCVSCCLTQTDQKRTQRGPEVGAILDLFAAHAHPASANLCLLQVHFCPDRLHWGSGFYLHRRWWQREWGRGSRGSRGTSRSRHIHRRPAETASGRPTRQVNVFTEI